MRIAAVFLLSGAVVNCVFVHMETNKRMRESFVRMSKADSNLDHEVVFAVKQNNLVELDEILMERSTPSNPMYQQWLTRAEITELTRNENGAQQVREWLQAHDITTISGPQEHNYIRASAPISRWEELLNAEFHNFEDQSARFTTQSKRKSYVRATEYSLPEELHAHVNAVFNTVQVPPSLHRRAKRKKMKESESLPFKTNLRVRTDASSALSNNNFSNTSSSDLFTTSDINIQTTSSVTVSFINDLYGIPSNIGDPTHSQSVFETADEYFSPSDLAIFQRTYGMANQPAEDIGGYSTAACSTSGTGDSIYCRSRTGNFISFLDSCCLLYNSLFYINFLTALLILQFLCGVLFLSPLFILSAVHSVHLLVCVRDGQQRPICRLGAGRRRGRRPA